MLIFFSNCLRLPIKNFTTPEKSTILVVRSNVIYLGSGQGIGVTQVSAGTSRDLQGNNLKLYQSRFHHQLCPPTYTALEYNSTVIFKLSDPFWTLSFQQEPKIKHSEWEYYVETVNVGMGNPVYTTGVTRVNHMRKNAPSG